MTPNSQINSNTYTGTCR